MSVLSQAGDKRLNIPVTRSNVLEESFTCIMKVRDTNKLRLRPNVTFTGENGYDYGGLSRYRESYVSLAKTLYKPVLLGNGSTCCPKRCSILTMVCLSMQLGEGTNIPSVPW